MSPFTGFALAIISHVLCSRFPMFAAKLLTHMMVACLGTQVGQVINEQTLQKKKSAVLLQALCFLSICNMVYFCRENISVGVFFSCFCPVAILMVRNEPTYTDMGGATECVTFEIC